MAASPSSVSSPQTAPCMRGRDVERAGVEGRAEAGVGQRLKLARRARLRGAPPPPQSSRTQRPSPPPPCCPQSSRRWTWGWIASSTTCSPIARSTAAASRGRPPSQRVGTPRCSPLAAPAGCCSPCCRLQKQPRVRFRPPPPRIARCTRTGQQAISSQPSCCLEQPPASDSDCTTRSWRQEAQVGGDDKHRPRQPGRQAGVRGAATVPAAGDGGR